MKGKNENMNEVRKDIIRYLNDEMSSSERNAFERKMQTDPFLAEAVDGYSGTDASEIEGDISKLKNDLIKRTKQRSTLIYRVAAAVVILIGISSVLLIRNLRQPGMKMAESRYAEEGIAAGEKMPEPSETEPVITEDLELGKQERDEFPDERSIAAYAAEKEDTVEGAQETPAGVIVEEELIPEAEADVVARAVPEKAAEVDKISARAAVAGEGETLDKRAGKKELVATAVAARPVDRKAMPVVGNEEYEKYLMDKQVYPSGYTVQDTVKVVLRLIIDENGLIMKMESTESPGDLFSEEAKRLVNEGPGWLPAIKGGELVRDTVELDIFFKRNNEMPSSES